MKLSHATANGFAGAWLDAARRAWLTRAAKGNTSRNSAGVLAVTTTEDVAQGASSAAHARLKTVVSTPRWRRRPLCAVPKERAPATAMRISAMLS